MLTLFKIDSRKNIVLNKLCVKLCPEFKNLSDDQISYIVLAYDYQSPYKQFPESERKKKAAHHVFKDTNYDAEKGKVMEVAIENYIGMQYDYRRETLRAYKNKVQRLNEQLEVEENPKSITQYMTAIENLHKQMDKIQQEIDRDENKQLLRGGGELSYIEQLHEAEKNLKDYLKRRANVSGPVASN